MDVFVAQGRAAFRGGRGVGVQALSDGVAAETAAGPGGKQRVGGMSSAFDHPGLEQGLNWPPSGTVRCLRPLPSQRTAAPAPRLTSAQLRLVSFGDAQAGLDRQGHHGFVAPSFPAVRVRCCEQGIEYQ